MGWLQALVSLLLLPSACHSFLPPLTHKCTKVVASHNKGNWEANVVSLLATPSIAALLLLTTATLPANAISDSQRELQQLQKREKTELSLRTFFNYEVDSASRTAARIAEAKQRSQLQYDNDVEEIEDLALLELRKEREEKLAATPQERQQKEREARVILQKERELARNERRAKRSEQIYRAEEETEEKILKQKAEAAQREEERFQAIEKEIQKKKERLAQRQTLPQ